MDVTARDFLAVFLDVDNRTKWDHHVVQLKVIDSEPSTNSDVIYWETKWPVSSLCESKFKITMRKDFPGIIFKKRKKKSNSDKKASAYFLFLHLPQKPFRMRKF